jgi:hypothetical protein
MTATTDHVSSVDSAHRPCDGAEAAFPVLRTWVAR